MKNEDVMRLAHNLTVAVKLTESLDGIARERVAGLQEKLVRICIKDFLDKCEAAKECPVDTQKPPEGRHYKAPIPVPGFTPPLKLEKEDEETVIEASDEEQPCKEAEKLFGNNTEDDAVFMADLAAEIKNSGPYNRHNTIGDILTEEKFMRAYAIAGTGDDLSKMLGIGTSTITRLKKGFRKGKERK